MRRKLLKAAKPFERTGPDPLAVEVDSLNAFVPHVNQDRFLVVPRDAAIAELLDEAEVRGYLVGLAGQQVVGHQVFKGHPVPPVLMQQPHQHLFLAPESCLTHIIPGEHAGAHPLQLLFRRHERVRLECAQAAFGPAPPKQGVLQHRKIGARSFQPAFENIH